MKTLKILSSFTVILAVLLVAGCVTAPAPSGYKLGGGGKDLLDIQIDSGGKVFFDSMEPFILTIDVENMGPFDAEDVETMLIGYGGLTAQDSEESLSDLHSMTSLLEKPNTVLGMPGGSETWDWNVYAPYVSEDTADVQITLTGEVYYRTKSIANQKIVIVEKEYVDKMDQQGKPIPVNPATEAENGPVSLNIEVPDPYVRMVDDLQSFRVKFVMMNDGSGNVYGRWASGIGDYDYVERVTVDVPKGLKADESNCDFSIPENNDFDNLKTLVVDDAHEKSKLRLISGGSYRELFCRFYVDRNYVNGYQTFQLDTQAEYSYLQDIKKTLTIKGTEEKPIQIEPLFPTKNYKSSWEDDPGTEAVFFTVKYKNHLLTTTSDLTVKASIAQVGVDQSDPVTVTHLVFKPKGEGFGDIGATCIPSGSEFTGDEKRFDGFVGCIPRPDLYIANTDGPYILILETSYFGESTIDRIYDAIDKA